MPFKADLVRFVLAAGGMDLVVVGQDASAPRNWTARLQGQFESAVNAYNADLIDSGVRGSALRPKFDQMWPDYAVLHVQ